MPRLTLDCGHRKEYVREKTGDRCWCDECGNWQTVARTGEYAVRCRDCRFGKRCGFSLAVAKLSASKHLKRYPTHLVYVLDGGSVVMREQTYSAESQEELF